MVDLSRASPSPPSRVHALHFVTAQNYGTCTCLPLLPPEGRGISQGRLGHSQSQEGLWAQATQEKQSLILLPNESIREVPLCVRVCVYVCLCMRVCLKLIISEGKYLEYIQIFVALF